MSIAPLCTRALGLASVLWMTVIVYGTEGTLRTPGKLKARPGQPGKLKDVHRGCALGQGHRTRPRVLSCV